jgi:hypothetical protein
MIRESRLPIDLAAVANPDDEDKDNIVFDIVDDAIVAFADAVCALRRVGQRFDIMGARIIG